MLDITYQACTITYRTQEVEKHNLGMRPLNFKALYLNN